MSPDGRTIAYVAENTGESQLYLRRLDEFEAIPVPGTEQAVAPFFSPDGRWVGFNAEGDLRKTTIEGTTTTDIAERAARLAGSSWGDNGNIVIGGPQLTRVSEGDGVPQELGKAIAGQFVWPQVLPGGQHLLVTTVGTKDGTTIAIVSMESGEVRPLLEGYAGARYASSGHLIVGDRDTHSSFAVVFDPDTLELRGAPTAVVDDVYFSPRSGMPHFAVSDSGVLVYVPKGSGGAALVWVDREGDVISPLGLGPGAYSHLRLSPDQKRIAVDNYTGGYRDIWVYELERGTRIRLTSGDQASNPIWTPDGERVTFSSLGDYLERDWPIHWRVADGSADGELLLAGKQRNRYPMSWSPDGTTLAYSENQDPGDRDLFVLALGEQPRPLLATSFNERSPVFSPDGRFLAYVSDESGRSEVYVLPYPAGDQKWPISTDGGAEPMWSRNGRELFYRDGYKMMVVPVETGAGFRAQRPRQLFEGRYYADASGHPNYDVSTDGQRFLMIQETEDERTQLNVVFNWHEELKRLVPTEN